MIFMPCDNHAFPDLLKLGIKSLKIKFLESISNCTTAHHGGHWLVYIKTISFFFETETEFHSIMKREYNKEIKETLRES